MGLFTNGGKEVKGQLVLITMKSGVVSTAFVSTAFLGEVVSRSGGKIVLKDVCAVYEQAGRHQGTGELILRTQFYTNSAISNGSLTFKEEDILWERLVDRETEKKEFMTGYLSALEALRAEKLNLVRATDIPRSPEGRA